LQAKNEQLLEQFENFLQQAEQLSPENNDAIEKASRLIYTNYLVNYQP